MSLLFPLITTGATVAAVVCTPLVPFQNLTLFDLATNQQLNSACGAGPLLYTSSYLLLLLVQKRGGNTL